MHFITFYLKKIKINRHLLPQRHLLADTAKCM